MTWTIINQLPGKIAVHHVHSHQKTGDGKAKESKRLSKLKELAERKSNEMQDNAKYNESIANSLNVVRSKNTVKSCFSLKQKSI